jgi:serine/threonine protein kinase
VISDRAIDRLRAAAAWPELDSRYEISGVAGYGGMGTVYIARDRVLDRDVAVKVLGIADQKGSRAARLQRESHILARLDHPGIVPVHDAGTLADGRAFYVMKLVKGRRLDALIADRVPLAERLTVFGRILDAVAFAHAHGIVHRDLKPENVMVGGFGEVFVMDWGVAQDGGADAEAAVVGTPGFMPPEQEQALGAVDRRADIYALGAILAHLIGDDAPAPLRAIAAKAAQASADRRYASVEAMAADLARFRSQDPVEAYQESWSERAVRLYRRYELPILLVLAYIVMRFVLLAWRGI